MKKGVFWAKRLCKKRKKTLFLNYIGLEMQKVLWCNAFLTLRKIGVSPREKSMGWKSPS